jgi:hypothetical protein
MNAAEIRQMLKDAIDQFPERDEMLADLGLQKRHSHVPMWLAGIGLLGVGLSLGASGGALFREVRIVRTKRRPQWMAIGSAVLGAGAGAGIVALIADKVRGTEMRTETPVRRETRVASMP